MENNKYYMYRHIRLDTNQIFYIGIGKKRKVHSNTIPSEYERAFSTKRTEYWKNITNKVGYKIEIMLETNDEELIREKEIEFISLYGRKDLNKGTLINLTDGGDGQLNTKFSKERNEKVSQALRKRIRSKETFEKISKAKYKQIIALKNNIEIKEYQSLTAASIDLSISIAAISKALKNDKYTARGFKWKYKSL
tara:strand:- start:265 stop:846 length:582 start_codon:yes stop_codon:yes gene_type:complete